MKTIVVYRHLKDGAIFYVGCGSPSRAKSRCGRNEKWLHIVCGGEFAVEIVRRFKSRERAYRFEKAEIKRLQPSANSLYGPFVSSNMERFKQRRLGYRRVVKFERKRK